MSDEKISPVAGNVIDKCGGVRIVSGIVGRSYNHVFKWRHPKSKGGTGGLIPASAQEALMRASIEGLVPLSPADFFDIPATSVATPQAER